MRPPRAVICFLFVPSGPFWRRGLKVAGDELAHPLDLRGIDIAQPGDGDRLTAVNQPLDVMRHDPAAADDPQPDLRRFLVRDQMNTAERCGCC